MSIRIENEIIDAFDIGDTVSFDYHGTRLTGKVIRVYNTRTIYHVLVQGHRYLVSIADQMKKE